MAYKIDKSQIPANLMQHSEKIKDAFLHVINSSIDKGLNYSLSLKKANEKVAELLELEERERQQIPEVTTSALLVKSLKQKPLLKQQELLT